MRRFALPAVVLLAAAALTACSSGLDSLRAKGGGAAGASASGGVDAGSDAAPDVAAGTGGAGGSTAGAGGALDAGGSAGGAGTDGGPPDGGGTSGGGAGGAGGAVDAGGAGGAGGSGGTPGVGTVACGGQTCDLANGQVCCFQQFAQNFQCVQASACAAITFACDGPEDCPGQVCCGIKLYGNVIRSAACQDSCSGANLVVICGGSPGACPVGMTCQPYQQVPAYRVCR